MSPAKMAVYVVLRADGVFSIDKKRENMGRRRTQEVNRQSKY